MRIWKVPGESTNTKRPPNSLTQNYVSPIGLYLFRCLVSASVSNTNLFSMRSRDRGLEWARIPTL